MYFIPATLLKTKIRSIRCYAQDEYYSELEKKPVHLFRKHLTHLLGTALQPQESAQTNALSITLFMGCKV